jgi:hypothetical protein
MTRPVSLILVGLMAVSASGARRPQWEQELYELGYLTFHLSNINVINGLYLTRDQTLKLRKLARQMEASATKPPTFRARLSPDAEKARKTLLEVRGILLAGRPVTEELEKRVNEARVVQSRLVRAGIRAVPASYKPTCGSCHTAPGKQGRGKRDVMTTTPRIRKLMNFSHAEAVYGIGGLFKLKKLSPRVEELLTNSQKAILGDFSCCLVPPQDLRDPVRVGQAEVSEKALELLGKVRSCPERYWPLMRSGILQRTAEMAAAVKPGVTAGKIAEAKKRMTDTLERARTLKDVDFELEKEKLAKDLRGAVTPPSQQAPHKSAFFLLIPGASTALDAYLKRLDAGKL